MVGRPGFPGAASGGTLPEPGGPHGAVQKDGGNPEALPHYFAFFCFCWPTRTLKCSCLESWYAL